MLRRHRRLVTTAACVGLFPFVLEFLMWLTPDIALIWLLVHQLYYAPLSGIGEPFFTADSDVGFWVQWPGRLLAVVVYAGAVILIGWGYTLWRARSSSGNHRAQH